MKSSSKIPLNVTKLTMSASVTVRAMVRVTWPTSKSSNHHSPSANRWNLRGPHRFVDALHDLPRAVAPLQPVAVAQPAKADAPGLQVRRERRLLGRCAVAVERDPDA